MKVLFNCLSSVSGGGEAYLRNISKPLLEYFNLKAKHKLIFLAHVDQSILLSEIPKSNIIWISQRRSYGLKRILWEMKNLSQIVLDNNIDVLFTPHQVAPYIPNIKNVLMIRNMEPFLFEDYEYSRNTWFRNKILAFVSSHCLRKTNRIIAVSDFASRQLIKIGISKKLIHLIYHGSPLINKNDFNHNKILNTLGINKDFIFTCGSLLPYRRCEDVINAFNLSINKLPHNMNLVIAGSSSDQNYIKKLKRLIKNSISPSRIILVGNVPWEKMKVLYSQCKIIVVSTEIEACPNIALEAMAAGCIILSSDKPPLPEMFSGCSLDYKARNVKVLSKKIIKTLEDKNLQIKLKKRTLERATYFSWPMCVNKTYSALTNWDKVN